MSIESLQPENFLTLPIHIFIPRDNLALKRGHVKLTLSVDSYPSSQIQYRAFILFGSHRQVTLSRC